MTRKHGVTVAEVDYARSAQAWPCQLVWRANTGQCAESEGLWSTQSYMGWLRQNLPLEAQGSIQKRRQSDSQPEVVDECLLDTRGLMHEAYTGSSKTGSQH